MAEIPQEQFASLVAARSAAGFEYPVGPAVIELATGPSLVHVRQAGAYITRATLTNVYGKTVPILYAPDDVRPAKLSASHGMTQKGIGGQHGPGRWADWELEEMQVVDRSHIRAVLQAQLPTSEPSLRRIIELDDHHGLTIRSSVTNATGAPQRERLGEHLYFSLPGGTLQDVHFLSHEVPLHDPEVQARIRDKGWFWPGYKGSAIVQFPDKKLVIRTTAEMVGSTGKHEYPGEQALGMMLWQRQGTESVCLEPLWGYSERGTDVGDEGFRLTVGATATLRTTIALVA